MPDRLRIYVYLPHRVGIEIQLEMAEAIKRGAAVHTNKRFEINFKASDETEGKILVRMIGHLEESEKQDPKGKKLIYSSIFDEVQAVLKDNEDETPLEVKYSEKWA